MSSKASTLETASLQTKKWPKLHSMVGKRRKDESFDDK